MKSTCIRLGVVVASLLAGVVAKADTLNFNAFPAVNSVPEVHYSGGLGGQFQTATGFAGNGDGNLEPASQTAGGLRFDVPYIVPNAAGGKVINAGSTTTTFYDVTLNFTGFTASANAVNVITQLVQPLSGGAFEFVSTDGISLLKGTASSAAIVGFGKSGNVMFNNVTFNGGLLNQYLITDTGTLNVTLLSSTNLSITSNRMDAFEADANGLLNASFVPVPSAVYGGMVLLGTLGACRFLRRRYAAV